MLEFKGLDHGNHLAGPDCLHAIGVVGARECEIGADRANESSGESEKDDDWFHRIWMVRQLTWHWIPFNAVGQYRFCLLVELERDAVMAALERRVEPHRANSKQRDSKPGGHWRTTSITEATDGTRITEESARLAAAMSDSMNGWRHRSSLSVKSSSN